MNFVINKIKNLFLKANFNFENLNIIITILIILITFILYLYFKKTNQNDFKKNKNLFEIISTDNLTEFKNYIKSNNLNIKSLHKIYYYSKISPLTFSIGNNSFKIFSYLLENNYNFNTNSKENPHPILYCSYYYDCDIRYLNELLKYKNKIDFNIKGLKFNANALEFAIWKEKKDYVKILSKFIKFNIDNFNNNTKIGLNFKDVNIEIKKILLRNVIFNKKLNQFRLYDLNLKRKINIGIFNTKSYFMYNFLNYS